MKKIIITESQFNKLFILPQTLLTEGDSRINKVRNVIMPRCFHGLLDLDATVTSPEYQVHNNPNTTWGDYLLFNLRHTFGLMGNSDVPLVLYIAPIAWSDEVGLDKRNDNNTEIDELTKICQLFKQEPNLFMKAKNTCPDYERLHQFCEPILQQMRDEANERMDNTNYTTNNQYTILKDIDYEKAHEIGQYSSLQNSMTCLCYTQSESLWNHWTQHGINTAFVCLKDGWQDMKPETGPNAPYDDYGLSMIFVFVNPKGELVASNTRWNHQNAGNTNVDHAFTEEEISNIIGIRFKDAFKVLTPEEREKRQKQKYMAMSQEFLSRMGDVNDSRFIRNHIELEIDEHVFIVSYKNCFNIYNHITNTLLTPDRWYCKHNAIHELIQNTLYRTKRIALFTDEETFNLYTPQGELIKEEIKGISLGKYFVCGYALIYNEDDVNYINKNGEILSPINFYSCENFNERTQTARVENYDGEFNYLTTEGKLLIDGWADYKRFLYQDICGIFRVNGKVYIYNLLTRENFFPDGFDELYSFGINHYCIAMINDKYNIITFTKPGPNMQFQIVSPKQWYDSIIPIGGRNVQLVLGDQMQTVNIDEL